jgi:hypothetical protein
MNLPVRSFTCGLLLQTAALGVGLGLASPARADLSTTFAAAAATTPRVLGPGIVYVEDRVGARFDSALRSSTMFVDRFTSSTMRYGHCRAGARCVRVIESNATHGHGAWTTSDSGRQLTTIRLSTALARRSWTTRRTILDHELGHAFGITAHNPRCTTPMWEYYTCRNGHLPPRTFSPAERAKLARW